MNNNTQYIYALFQDGTRMSGPYSRFFLDRQSARAWKQKAKSSNSVNGDVTIARVPTEAVKAPKSRWETVS